MGHSMCPTSSPDPCKVETESPSPCEDTGADRGHVICPESSQVWTQFQNQVCLTCSIIPLCLRVFLFLLFFLLVEFVGITKFYSFQALHIKLIVVSFIVKFVD